MKLNLGCGFRKLDGYINVDKYDRCCPDKVLDMECFSWPWGNDSVDDVILHHVLEHLGQKPNQFIKIMHELYRIMACGAEAHITVPHPRSDGFLGDPTHVRPITPDVLKLFSQEWNKKTITEGWPNTPLGIYHNINFELTNVKYLVFDKWGAEEPSVVEKAIHSQFNVVANIEMTICKRPLLNV